MGFTNIIIKRFYIEDIDLEYFVGINRIKIDLPYIINKCQGSNGRKTLHSFFDLIKEFQIKNQVSLIQFIKDKFILNQDHIFIACYYILKAFHYRTNISNKKNIEFLLYLSTYRQIKKGFESFGITLQDLNKGELTFCIVSKVNNISQINKNFLIYLNASELELDINNLSIKKLNRIIEFYDFSDKQITSVLNSYGIKKKSHDEFLNDFESLTLAIFDLICEKMALLNLEKKIEN